MNAAQKIAAAFILWAIHRAVQPTCVVTFGGDVLFQRYEFMWPDEYLLESGRMYNRLHWWRPFNAFVHRWCPAPELREAVHDHPRWSITLCLRGRIIEHTPWGARTLTPGSVVFRSHKAIHSFEVPAGYRGKTWTLFVVGRRRHRQNTYVVTPQ